MHPMPYVYSKRKWQTLFKVLALLVIEWTHFHKKVTRCHEKY